MAKELWRQDIDRTVDWGGDENTGGLPVAGEVVQKFIKDSLDSKAGYIGFEKITNKYVLCRDKELFDAYAKTVEDGAADRSMIIGDFTAPFEYDMIVDLDEPENAYKVSLVGENNNVIKFSFHTEDSKGNVIKEAVMVTYTFKKGATVQTVMKQYTPETTTVTFDANEYLLEGINNVTMTVVGQTTTAASTKTITFRIVKLSLEDNLDISQAYNIADAPAYLSIPFKITGEGNTRMHWFIDGEKLPLVNSEDAFVSPNNLTSYKNIRLEPGTYTQGTHSLQFYFECTIDGDKFQTPIHYRDFFVFCGEKQESPMIGASTEFPYSEGIVPFGTPMKLYDVKQYEPSSFNFSVFNPGISDTNVEVFVDDVLDGSYITQNGKVLTHQLNLNVYGSVSIFIKSGDASWQIGPNEVAGSDMSIKDITDNLLLDLSAYGRTNLSANKEDWSYSYNEGSNVVTYSTTFNNFLWTDTSGWYNNRLIISNGTSIDIDMQPFANSNILLGGSTFEFEFSTMNVVNDDAIICQISNGSNGIFIKAAEATIVSTEGKTVSTKFKSEENTRIAFVITPQGTAENRERFMYIYVNGVLCGAINYSYTDSFYNEAPIHFEGTEQAEIKLSSLRFYGRALTDDEILNNYMLYRDTTAEMIALYTKNDIYEENGVTMSIDKLANQLPIMIFTGIGDGTIADLEGTTDKDYTVHFDIEYKNIQDPTKNFTVEYARVKPQGTSSMGYPKKNYRFYTRKEDETVLYDYTGTPVPSRKYSFNDNSQAVDCWCLKADFAESSSSHNTGTARIWNEVMKNVKVDETYVCRTKAQQKAIEHGYSIDVRTTVDGFPILLFYKENKDAEAVFIGKYNFNNDKSTESVFGFTGGPDEEGKEWRYVKIGPEGPVNPEKVEDEYGNDITIGTSIDNPHEDASPYVYLADEGMYYQLEGVGMFDNVKTECWEILDSSNDTALFKALDFSLNDDKDQVGGAFESRYPDGGDGNYNLNELKTFCKWLVACRYKSDKNDLVFGETLTINSFSNPEFNGTYPDTAENRKLKFFAEKWDHIDKYKMAAYYIYLMRFGGVDQTVKNAMLTTEGNEWNDVNKPSQWYFINYDNDTIFGVRNDGRLIHSPYIDRQTIDTTYTDLVYAYAGHDSTLWNNLEDDAQFMEVVRTVDQAVYTAGLTYDNMVDMYNKKQSGTWPERIFNQDSQYKYIGPYKNVDDPKDYLYDLQGPRAAHRQWWISKRFGLYDSMFISGEYKSNEIRFKTGAQLAGSAIKIMAGNKLYYGYGTNNIVIESGVLLEPGQEHTFYTKTDMNVGTPVSLWGAPNIEKLDINNWAGSLTEIGITGARSATLGTKLKELYLGNYKNGVTNASVSTISGLEAAEKLEILDMSGFLNFKEIDLSTLTKFKTLKAYGSGLMTGKFAKGGAVETLELPSTITTLPLEDLMFLTYDGLKFENDDYSTLTTLTISNCQYLMNDPTFVFNWINTKVSPNYNCVLNLNGINWTLDTPEELLKMKNFKNLIVKGKIHINKNLTPAEVSSLTEIFGERCFVKGQELYITAFPDIYVTGASEITRGEKKPYEYNISTVALEEGTVTTSLLERDEKGNTTAIGSEVTYEFTGDQATISIAESNREIHSLRLYVYYAGNDNKTEYMDILVHNRTYPETADVNGNTIINAVGIYDYALKLTPELTNGFYNVTWSLMGSAVDNGFLSLSDKTDNSCRIIAAELVNSTATLTVRVVRQFDAKVLATVTKTITISDPDTIMTPESNPEVFSVLYEAGLTDSATKLTKQKAAQATSADFDGLFTGNKKITSFDEFQWFNVRVTSIPADCFKDCTKLTSIVLPICVDTIYANAFRSCGALRSITLSESLSIIGDNVFDGCVSLESIEFNNNLTNIGKRCFNSCSTLKKVVLGNGIKVIPEGCFDGARAMHTCVMPNGVTEIHKQAFRGCTALKSLKLYPTLQMISNAYVKNGSAVISSDDYSFGDCLNLVFEMYEANDTYYVTDGSLYMKHGTDKYLIHHNPNQPLESEGTLYILAYALEGLKTPNVIVPNDYVFNGINIFNGSSGNSITLSRLLSDSLKSEGLFYFTGYQQYNFANGETTIPAKCFYSVSGITSYTVPVGITTIEGHAFEQNKTIQELTIPSTVQSIGEYALANSNALKKLYLLSPSIITLVEENILYKSTIDNIYVYGSLYETYCSTYPTLKPYFVMYTLPNEGYVRLIKDGQYVYHSNVGTTGATNVTVMGLPTYQRYDGYFVYNTTDNLTGAFTVELDGSVVGNIDAIYSDIYVGDNNLSLYDGDGVDFSKNIYNKSYILSEGGWYYDKNLEGIRSAQIIHGGSTSIEIYMPQLAGKEVDIWFGQNSEHSDNTANNDWDQCNIFDRSGNLLISLRGSKYQTTNGLIKLTSPDGYFKFTYKKDLSGSYGVDAFWLHSIGNFTFNTPEYPAEYSTELKLTLSADNANNDALIGTKVHVFDNENVNKVITWKGSEIATRVPNGIEVTVSCDDIISKTKWYKAPESVKLTTNGSAINKNFLYTTIATGIYAVGTDGTLYTNNYPSTAIGVLLATAEDDLFMYKTGNSVAWGAPGSEIPNLPEVRVEDVEDDFDGYSNSETIYLAVGSKATAVEAARNTNFYNLYEGYLPSYGEMLTMLQNQNQIDTILNEIGGNELYYNDVYWTSTNTNTTQAWAIANDTTGANTGSPVVTNNTESRIVRAFGRRKIN